MVLKPWIVLGVLLVGLVEAIALVKKPLPLAAMTASDSEHNSISLSAEHNAIQASEHLSRGIKLHASVLALGESRTPVEIPDLFRPIYSHPSFNSQRLDQQLALYADFLATWGPPDVLVVGSSRSLQGVDPVVLEQTLKEQGYSNLTVFNFGINGATAQVVDLLLRRVLSPEHLPQLIVWADGSRAFNSGRPDVTFNGIAASDGYKRLAEGDRPIEQPQMRSRSELPSPPLNVCSDIWVDPIVDLASPAFEGPVISASEQNAVTQEVTLAHRFEANLPCHQPRFGSTTAVPSEESQPEGQPAPDLTAILSSRQDEELDSRGFLPISTRFDPATYYQTHPVVAGQYDGSYVPFQLEGEQMEAMRSVAAFARDRQIPLVFVNLPLSQDYLDATRRSYEQQFRQHMQQLASQEGFIFRDLLQQWPTQNDYFADPSHLNRYGAQAVATHLAKDLGMPWSIFQ